MEEFMMPPPGVTGGPAVPAPAGLPAPVLQGVAQEEGANGPSEGGQGFFDKLRTDPKMSQAMLMVGLRMMQGNRPGQDGAGMMSDAMMAGAAAHNMLSYNEKEDGRKQAEDGRKQQESDALVASRNAATEASNFSVEKGKALLPEEMKKVRAEIARLKAEGDLQAVRLLGEQVKNDPDLVRKDLLSGINARNASAASGYASAENQKASAGLAKVRTDAANKLLEEGDPNAVLHGKGNTEGGSKQTALDDKVLMALQNDPDPTMAAWATARLAERVGYGQGKGTPATVGKPATAAKKVATEADIRATMRATKKSRNEVLEAIKARGYSLEGEE